MSTNGLSFFFGLKMRHNELKNILDWEYHIMGLKIDPNGFEDFTKKNKIQLLIKAGSCSVYNTGAY